MLFNSYEFLFAFLPVVLLVWWVLPWTRARLVWLTLASWLFYGWWDYRFVPLMILSSSADYAAGLLITRTSSTSRKRLWLIVLLVFNLGLLAIFKYYDFFVHALNGLGRLFGQDPHLPLLGLILPVGISFYTFNSISYTIDVYRGRITPAKGLLEFVTFVSMFPHLIAGPIVRYSDMGPQFENLEPRPKASDQAAGIYFFVVGMTKKIVIADVLAKTFVTPLLSTPDLRLAGAWLGSLAYTFQIYFDFSAYSDMAVGLAFVLGLRFPQNFDSPYKSLNISEFWRRWHMSLSFWLRDYLFIPLGGSRGSRAQTARNLFITMFLGGLWHGAAWTFVVWGMYHGVLLAGHAALKARGLTPRSSIASVTLTFLAVLIGWVFFRASTITDAFATLRAMAGLNGVEPVEVIKQMLAFSPVASGVLLLTSAITFAAPNSAQNSHPRARWAAALLAIILLACSTQFAEKSPFLYYQF